VDINKRIFCISDLHSPYQHRDALDFIKECKKKYRPTRWVCLGDEVDGNSWSFHQSDPDLNAPTKELEQAKIFLHKLQEVVPVCQFLESNHGSLVYRKRKYHMLPEQMVKDYADVLEVNKKNWTWHHHILIKSKWGQFYFIHNLNRDCVKSAQTMGYDGYVQSHFHSIYTLSFFSTPESLKWACTAGSLVDKDSLAFAYSRISSLKRPVLGCLLINMGIPHLIPMRLLKGGRWDGKLTQV
jgi:hypothetical protein